MNPASDADEEDVLYDEDRERKKRRAEKLADKFGSHVQPDLEYVDYNVSYDLVVSLNVTAFRL